MKNRQQTTEQIGSLKLTQTQAQAVALFGLPAFNKSLEVTPDPATVIDAVRGFVASTGTHHQATYLQTQDPAELAGLCRFYWDDQYAQTILGAKH